MKMKRRSPGALASVTPGIVAPLAAAVARKLRLVSITLIST
jgi:hypothetical protein